MLSTRLPFALWSACVLAGCNVGTQQGYEPAQPVPFSHAQHAGEYQIDCTYCHSGAERSRHAGVPAASVCMNCHAQVKPDSPLLAPLKQALDTGKPFAWTRVHRLPDYAFFDHSRHVVAGGLACQTCHGPVETMVRVKQVQSMTMGWCLSCHRASARQAKDPAAAAHLASATDCASCHY